MKTLEKYVIGLFNTLIVVFLAIMLVLVFGNVILRYVFNSGITVSEELSRILFVWLTFLGAVVAMKDHAHLGIDSLTKRLPPLGKKICVVVTSLLFATLHEFGVDAGQPWHAWLILMGLYAASGGFFAWLYWRSGRLQTPIVAHAINNLVLCVGMLWETAA